MRKLLIAALVTLALAVPVMAEPLAEFDTEGGSVIVTSYEVAEDDGDIYLYIFFDWTNNGDDRSEPMMDELSFIAFQNGKEVDSDIGCDTIPKNTDGYFGTQVMPGYTTNAYTGFKLADTSEVTVHATDYSDDYAVFTINPAEAAPELDAPEETPVSDEPDAPTVGEKIADLEARIEALEARVSELEG